MTNETIQEIVVNDQKELLLKLIGNGKPMYQYVYREAAGVYWDENQKGFKSTPMKEMTVSEWFLHIKDIVKSGIGIELKIDKNLTWKNIPDSEIIKIKNALQQSI